MEKSYSCALWAMRAGELYSEVAREIARELRPDLDELREALDRVGEYCGIDVSLAKRYIDLAERSLEEGVHPKPTWISGWERMAASINYLILSIDTIGGALEERAKREGGVPPFEKP
jgi:hypothetical protein